MLKINKYEQLARKAIINEKAHNAYMSSNRPKHPEYEKRRANWHKRDAQYLNSVLTEAKSGRDLSFSCISRLYSQITTDQKKMDSKTEKKLRTLVKEYNTSKHENNDQKITAIVTFNMGAKSITTEQDALKNNGRFSGFPPRSLPRSRPKSNAFEFKFCRVERCILNYLLVKSNVGFYPVIERFMPFPKDSSSLKKAIEGKNMFLFKKEGTNRGAFIENMKKALVEVFELQEENAEKDQDTEERIDYVQNKFFKPAVDTTNLKFKIRGEEGNSTLFALGGSGYL